MARQPKRKRAVRNAILVSVVLLLVLVAVGVVDAASKPRLREKASAEVYIVRVGSAPADVQTNGELLDRLYPVIPATKHLSPASLAQSNADLGRMHDAFDEDQRRLSVAAGRPWRSQAVQAADGCRELESAVAAAREYLQDFKPSELADFHTQLAKAEADWNAGIRPIYVVVGKEPPTI